MHPVSILLACCWMRPSLRLSLYTSPHLLNLVSICLIITARLVLFSIHFYVYTICCLLYSSTHLHSSTSPLISPSFLLTPRPSTTSPVRHHSRSNSSVLKHSSSIAPPGRPSFRSCTQVGKGTRRRGKGKKEKKLAPVPDLSYSAQVPPQQLITEKGIRHLRELAHGLAYLCFFRMSLHGSLKSITSTGSAPNSLADTDKANGAALAEMAPGMLVQGIPRRGPTETKASGSTLPTSGLAPWRFYLLSIG